MCNFKPLVQSKRFYKLYSHKTNVLLLKFRITESAVIVISVRSRPIKLDG